MVATTDETPAWPQLTVRFTCYLLPLILLGLAVYVLLPQIATTEHSLQVIHRNKARPLPFFGPQEARNQDSDEQSSHPRQWAKLVMLTL
jgi:hypothetical protein